MKVPVMSFCPYGMYDAMYQIRAHHCVNTPAMASGGTQAQPTRREERRHAANATANVADAATNAANGLEASCIGFRAASPFETRDERRRT